MMNRKYLPIAGAAVLLLLLTGAKCVFVATSGGDSSDKDKDKDEDTPTNEIVIASSGRFIDGPVEGLRYESGALSGTTGPRGEFLYESGNSVRFYIGTLALGRAAPGKAVMSPLDLVEHGSLATPAVINIARLLQSLDAVPGDDAITLPANIAQRNTPAAGTLATTLEYLDFHDETGFVNGASQLVATLTADYPFTAVLVDAASAQRHLAASLTAAGIPH